MGLGLWGASFIVGLPAVFLAFLLLGLAAAVAGLFDRTLGLFGVSVLCLLDSPMQFLVLHGGILRHNTLNYWLLVIIVLYAPFLLRLRVPQCILLQLFALLMAVGLIRSEDMRQGLADLLQAVSYFGLFVYFFRSRWDEQAWIWMALINASFAAVGGLAFLLVAPRIVAANPNQWFFLPLTGILSVCLAFPYAASRRKAQVIMVLLAAIDFMWLFLCASRGPLIVGGCGLLYLLLTVRGVWRRLLVPCCVLLVASVAVVAWPQKVGVTMSRFGRVVDPNVSMRDRSSGRFDLALGGWYMFLDNPLGVGTGGYRTVWSELPLRAEMSGFRAGERFWSHSAWVSALAENGVPGVVLLLAFVLSFAATGYRKRGQGLFPVALLATTAIGLGLFTEDFRIKGFTFFAAGATVLLHRETLGRCFVRKRQPTS